MAGVLAQTFTATGASTNNIRLRGDYNVSIGDTFVGTIIVQRNFNDGRGWLPVKSYTAPAEELGYETEPGVDYRLFVSAYTSGSIAARLSQ